MAEDERLHIVKRTHEGRQIARANSVKMGRKPKLNPHQIKEARQRLGAAKASDKNLLLDSSQPCVINSFGPANSDKVFYVIRQEGLGREIFFLVASTLCHLHIADRCGLYPVMDFETLRTEYNENDTINGTSNAWEYFFLPVSQHELPEVYQSKRVLFSQNPPGYSMSITSEPKLYPVYDKYLKVRSGILEVVDDFWNYNFAGDNVLGIHFKEQELRTAPGHWFPPTKKQILTSATKLLEKHKFSKICAVSAELSYIDFLKENFGPMVIATNCHRTRNINAYRQHPRPNHKYLLGREISIDTLLLAQCHALIGCTSNVATFARFANRGRVVVEDKTLRLSLRDTFV
jgi:hypothetical protein